MTFQRIELNRKREKIVSLRTTGNEKSKVTLALSCMNEGTRLKPMVVFQKKFVSNEKFLKGIIFEVHPQGRIDEDGCRKWIKEVRNL